MKTTTLSASLALALAGSTARADEPTPADSAQPPITAEPAQPSAEPEIHPVIPETLDPHQAELVEHLKELKDSPATPVDPLKPLQGAHGADAPKRERRDPTWDTWGDLRGRVVGGTDPALDDLGTPSGRHVWGSSRLIAGADWKQGEHTTVELELEALNGMFAGDRTSVGTVLGDDTLKVRRADYRDMKVILPRKLDVAYAAKWGSVRVGAQTFTWGTGMLANDGAGDPDFGDANTGSVVARGALVLTPWRASQKKVGAARGLGFFVAGDLVLRDDNASLFEGDLAGAGVAGLRLQTPRVELGALFVGRWQRDRVDPNDPRPDRAITTAFPFDAYGRFVLTPAGANERVLLEGELATVHGHTNRSYLDATAANGARVASLGALVRLRYDNDKLRVTAKVEVGFASGDNDSRDDVVRAFSFHTDTNAGMLLFDEVLPLMTARSVDRAADPALVDTPPPGARYTVNQGAISNAVYVNPVLRYRPLPDLDLRFGWLTAWSAGDFADTYQTGVSGGYNVTAGGVSGGSHALGHELDLGLRYTVHIPGATALTFGAEGASFLPGAAFDGVGGDRLGTQWLGRGRASFTW